jgi:hypothetical protein
MAKQPARERIRFILPMFYSSSFLGGEISNAILIQEHAPIAMMMPSRNGVNMHLI